MTSRWYKGSMKSGPTLNPCTCTPRLRKAPRIPSTMEVLPTPLCVPGSHEARECFLDHSICRHINSRSNATRGTPPTRQRSWHTSRERLRYTRTPEPVEEGRPGYGRTPSTPSYVFMPPSRTPSAPAIAASAMPEFGLGCLPPSRQPTRQQRLGFSSDDPRSQAEEDQSQTRE